MGVSEVPPLPLLLLLLLLPRRTEEDCEEAAPNRVGADTVPGELPLLTFLSEACCCSRCFSKNMGLRVEKKVEEGAPSIEEEEKVANLLLLALGGSVEGIPPTPPSVAPLGGDEDCKDAPLGPPPPPPPAIDSCCCPGSKGGKGSLEGAEEGEERSCPGKRGMPRLLEDRNWSWSCLRLGDLALIEVERAEEEEE